MVIGQQGADVFDVRMALRAFSDSQYQSTAYAIAELIDNAIDAEAPRVDVLFQERIELVRQRTSAEVSAVAVVDNGAGMDLSTLWKALQFGGRDEGSQSGIIGKYGVGLPTASVTQCSRVDVWTWQDGISSALHCYLDVDDIDKGASQLPFPDAAVPPSEWISETHPEIVQSRTGTLVLWTKLRKLDYRRAATIMGHIEQGVGRIYRHFISAGDVIIRMKSFGGSSPREIQVRPNDPLYLMENTTTPAPWNESAMFRQWDRKLIPVKCGGASFDVEVVYSIVKDEALRPSSYTERVGTRPYGRHAAENTGISVVRANRELVMLPPVVGRVGRNEEVNRWWGCEVRFPSGCDDLFGVDHNKQMAANFRNVLEEFYRNPDAASQRLADDAADNDADNQGLFKIAQDIRNVTGDLLTEVNAKNTSLRPPRPGPGKGPETPEDVAEDVADASDREAQSHGDRQLTDTDREREEVPAEDRQAGHQAVLEEAGFTRSDALAEAERMVRDNVRFKFIPRRLSGSQMFDVNSSYGVHYVALNLNHPMYNLLREIEDEAIQNQDEALSGACIALRLLFTSWAAAEGQYPDGDQRRRVQNFALDWGRQAELAFQAERNRRGDG